MGDSIRLPYEGLSKAKISKKNLTFEKQNLIFNRGMFSVENNLDIPTIDFAKSLGLKDGVIDYPRNIKFIKIVSDKLELISLSL